MAGRGPGTLGERAAATLRPTAVELPRYSGTRLDNEED